MLQGKLAEAFKACRNSLAIRERLAAADRNKTEWQRDHAVSYAKLVNPQSLAVYRAL